VVNVRVVVHQIGELLREHDSAVCAATIYHMDLFAPSSHRLQTKPDIGFFIKRQDEDGQLYTVPIARSPLDEDAIR